MIKLDTFKQCTAYTVVIGATALAAYAIGLAHGAETVPPTVQTVADTYGLPECITEDSTMCYWDAASMGNGEGRSYIAWDDWVQYFD